MIIICLLLLQGHSEWLEGKVIVASQYSYIADFPDHPGYAVQKTDCKVEEQTDPDIDSDFANW